jgi:hypothetical protein
MTKTIFSISVIFAVKTLAAFLANFDSKKKKKIINLIIICEIKTEFFKVLI